MRSLLILEKIKVHVVNITESDAESGIAWDYTAFDIGAEFPENELNTTWIMGNRWQEGVEYRWISK